MKWGIIGAGRIAHRFVKCLENFEDCELYAVSCRTQVKADAFKEEHHACIAYAGFENIVTDPNIDAVYIATPHQYHYEWIIKCLEAKKAVLCEKPAYMNSHEMKQVMQCSRENHVLFMEAMKTRFIPLYKEIKQRIYHQEIGEILSIETSLCNEMDLEIIKDTYLMDPKSGGVLTDTGIYCIAWLEDYLKDSYTIESVETHVQNGVNLYTNAKLHFDKVSAVMECAMDRKKDRNAVIQGTKGKIIVEDLHRPQKAIIETNHIEEFNIPYVIDDFYGQLEEFIGLWKQNQIESKIMPLESSLRCAQIMDAIQEYVR